MGCYQLLMDNKMTDKPYWIDKEGLLHQGLPELKQAKTITLPLREFNILMLESFRYAIKRETYACSDCVERLIKHWGDICPAYQTQIQRDIRLEMEDDNMKDYIKKEWERVLELEVKNV
jgi:hypothetical protein